MKRLYFASLNDCNEDCLFCVRGGDEAPIDFIGTKKAKEILSQKRKEDYQELYFDGGEPTLRKDLFDLIQFAQEAGYRSVQILTNGVLLSDENLVKKILSVRKTKIFSLSFSVSLHSHKKDISEKLVGRKNTFGKTIKGIENLLKNKAKNVSIYHIIAKYNYKDLPEFVKFANKEFPQIRNITFSFIYPAGGALKNKQIFPRLSEVEPYFLKAAELCQKYGISFSLSTCGTVPLCFLKGYEDVLINQQELDQPEKVGLVDAKKDVKYQLASKEFHQKTKIKSSECQRCIFDDKCGGIWRDYAQMYGIKELKPIEKNSEAEKPNVLLLLTGFSCNNNCVFCSNVADRSFDSQTKELTDKIRKGYKSGFTALEFIGGEVAIRPDFLDLVSFAREVGFKDIRLTTNGRIFSYPEFTQKAKKAGLNMVMISLYGHNDKTHEAITRAPGSFKQTVEGIKNISKEKGIILTVNTVVSKINYKFLDKIGEFICRFQPKEWHILELLPDGRAIKLYNTLSVPYEEISWHLDKVVGLAGRKIGRIDFFDFPFCVFSKNVLSNKDINFFTPKNRFEDITQQSHDSVFRVEKIKQGKKIVYQDKYKIKPAFCRPCEYYERCGGITKQHYQRYRDKEIRALFKKHNF